MFGDSFLVLLFWLPMVFLWFAVLFDILRRPDLSGLAIAVWLVVIIVVPFLGALGYFVARPRYTKDNPEPIMPERSPGRDVQMH